MMRLSRRVALALLVFLILLLGVLGGVGWIGSERALHPAYHIYKRSLRDFPDLQPANRTFQGRDGITLHGRFFAGTNHALVVLVAGYGDTQDQMLPFASFLHRAGFNVVTYDSRARAESGGKFVTLGFLEQDDLIDVVTKSATFSGVDAHRIGVLGISMGGATAILSAAKDTNIRAVVDDCGFSDAPRVIAASFEHFIHLPSFPFAPVTVWIASRRAGVDVDSVRPMNVVSKLSPRPILVIHGLADYVVPPENSRRIFDAAANPKELWLVPNAGHAEEHRVAPAEYEARVTRFFQDALK